MTSIRKILSVLILFTSIIAFCGCGFNTKKSNEGTDKGNQENVNTEALAQFQNEKQELLQKANARLAELNKKILDLNDKIKSKGTKLTEDQNKAIDAFEAKRASVNQRIHEIKNVSHSNWESFKKQFETDMENCCSDIDKILAEL